VLASAGTGGNGRLNRVLVVDDDRHIVDWLKEALTNNGFTVREPITAMKHSRLRARIRPT